MYTATVYVKYYYFRVPSSVSKQDSVQNFSNKNEFDLHKKKKRKTRRRNTFPYEWFWTKIPFDTKAQGDSEMAYFEILSKLVDKFTFLFSEYTGTADKTDKVFLLREIQTLKRVGQHPNIVNLVGACTQGGKLLRNHRMTNNPIHKWLPIG